MDVALVFPPVTDPRSPHLAIPSLAAYARREGCEVSVHDVDVAALDHLMSPDALDEAARASAQIVSGDYPASTRARRALERAELVLGSGLDPLGILRTDDFYDPHLRQFAREGIECLAELHGAACGRVTYGIGPVRYAVDNIDPARFTDLLRVTNDSDADLFGAVWEDLTQRLQDEDPLLVGISILNQQQILPGLRCARILKASGHRVVLGGTLFAKFVERLRLLPKFFEIFADAVVPYEGEKALLDLVDRAGRGAPLCGAVNTLAADSRGEVIAGPLDYEDVEQLPTPDFSDLPLELYLAPEPVLPLLSGKGCYFNRCRFCDIPMINSIVGRNYRRRSADRIVEDVVRLNVTHGARFFEFTDEALAPNYLSRFASVMEGAEVQARFVGYARLERRFDADLFGRMHDAGFRKLFFGLESGSQRMIDRMDKQISVSDVPRILKDCSDAGISFHVFTMIGLPEEREDDARETLNFFLRNEKVLSRPDHSFDIHRFTLDLRTDYYERAEEFGIQLDRQRIESADFPLSTEEWTNTRGLSPQEADALRAEFEKTLKVAYRTYRSFPAHLWPGYEEYAVLYAEHYRRRDFNFRYALPSIDGTSAFRLVWAAGIGFEHKDGAILARNLRGAVRIPLLLATVLGPARDYADVRDLMTVLEHQIAGLTDGNGVSADHIRLRATIDTLLDQGMLWLRPALSSGEEARVMS